MRSLFASSLSCNPVQFRRTRLSAAIGAAFAAAAAFWAPQAQAADLNCKGTPCTVQDGDLYDNVYGNVVVGISGNVTITGGMIGSKGKAAEVVGATADGTTNATGNQVTITGGRVGEGAAAGNLGNVYGGRSGAGDATDNTVTIRGGRIDGAVWGGQGGSGNATKNIVIISDGIVFSSVRGGESDAGNATGNKVTISGGNTGSVTGGYSAKDTAGGSGQDGNEVIISDAASVGSVSGGESEQGDAIGNKVRLSGGTVGDHVYGGYSGSGNATGNEVELTGTSSSKGGGTTFSKTDAAIYGGYVHEGSGQTRNNTVRLRETFTGDYSKLSLYGGNREAVGNELRVNTGDLGGGLTLGAVNNFGKLTFRNEGNVTIAKLVNTGMLTKNGSGTLTLTGAASNHSGGAQVNAGTLRLEHAQAVGTKAVSLADSTKLELEFTGNYANQITGTGAVYVNAGTGNVLTLTHASNSYSGGTNVVGGTLNVNNLGALGAGAVHVGPEAALRLSAPVPYGSFSQPITGEGSTLEVAASGTVLHSIKNFGSLYFILPSTVRPGDTMLTINGGDPTVFALHPVSGDAVNVGVAVAGGRPLEVGHVVTLLKNDSGLQGPGGSPLASTDYQKVTIPGRQGFSVNYDFTLANTDTALTATVVTAPPEPYTPPNNGDNTTPVNPPNNGDNTKPDNTPVNPPNNGDNTTPNNGDNTKPGYTINPQSKAVAEGVVARAGTLVAGADQVVNVMSSLVQRFRFGARLDLGSVSRQITLTDVEKFGSTGSNSSASPDQPTTLDRMLSVSTAGSSASPDQPTGGEQKQGKAGNFFADRDKIKVGNATASRTEEGTAESNRQQMGEVSGGNVEAKAGLRAKKLEAEGGAQSTAQAVAAPQSAVLPFGQVAAQKLRTQTGSHVDASGGAAVVGVARYTALPKGALLSGIFFEYGDGRHTTHNEFDTGDVTGKGDASYYGAGVMARAQLPGNERGAPFVEGSVRAGRIQSNWHSDDLRDAATGQRAQYDIHTPYLGAHVGAGYRWQAGARTQVEVYGQYLYTHMDGKDATVARDPYHFDAVKSRRTRVGAKADWQVNDTASLYAGAAWEREFDGTARATAYSLDVPAPTMKGNSAVLDAGVSFQSGRNLTSRVGVTGYAGKRKGAAANLEVQYLF